MYGWHEAEGGILTVGVDDDGCKGSSSGDCKQQDDKWDMWEQHGRTD